MFRLLVANSHFLHGDFGYMNYFVMSNIRLIGSRCTKRPISMSTEGHKIRDMALENPVP